MDNDGHKSGRFRMALIKPLGSQTRSMGRIAGFQLWRRSGGVVGTKAALKYAEVLGGVQLMGRWRALWLSHMDI